MLSHLLRILNLKRSNPLDYSDDEIANAGDVWLASVASSAGKAADAPGGEASAAEVAGVAGSLPHSHISGDSACPRQ